MENIISIKLLGFIAGFWYLRKQLASTKFLFHFLISIALAIIGSKMAMIIEASFSDRTLSVTTILDKSGRTGLAILFAYVYCSICFKWIHYKDIYSILIATLIGLFIVGKWHCFIIKDSCHGYPTNLPWAVNYNGIIVHPTILYDVLFGGVLTCTLLFLEYRSCFSYRSLFGLGIISLSTYGVFIEFLKMNAFLFGSFSLNQISYFLIIIIESILLIFIWKRKH